MSKTTPKRIHILTADEVKELYGRPLFNQAEREEFFALDEDILKVLDGMEKLETKLYLVLLIGYFRAKPVVPKFTLREVKEDVEYICQTYFPDESPINSRKILKGKVYPNKEYNPKIPREIPTTIIPIPNNFILKIPSLD